MGGLILLQKLDRALLPRQSRLVFVRRVPVEGLHSDVFNKLRVAETLDNTPFLYVRSSTRHAPQQSVVVPVTVIVS